ncbi:MAG: gluconate 2-dehydrogenase subunit 3 family protein [Solirubrobacteraceae bacterium]
MPDMRSAAHLPNLRADGEPLHPSWLPRQRVGTSPQMIGRFPDYDVLESASDWDPATRAAVMARVEPAHELSFFTPEQELTLRAFCDVVLAQDSEPRVPVVELLDEKLTAGRLDGYQYEDMPDDRQTWRIVLEGLDHNARQWHGRSTFAECEAGDQDGIVKALARDQLADGPWAQLNVSRAWSVCTRMMLEAFYSHPWAWNEIGFGGPAYPRGYMRLGPLSTLEPRERPGASDADPVRMTAGPQVS